MSDSQIPEQEEQGIQEQRGKDKGKPYWNAARATALIGIIEAVSLVLWARAEDFEKVPAYYAKCLACCGFVAGGAYAAHKLVIGKKTRLKKIVIWTAWIMTCIVIFLVRSPEQELTTSFTIFARFGDSKWLPLTNDFLNNQHLTVGGTFPDGARHLVGIVPGCFVIPVKRGQSNEAFFLKALNESATKVSDLEIVVSFPSDWNCGLDSSKWRNVEASYPYFSNFVPVSIWKPTNMQSFCAVSPWNLFPLDAIELPPITNRCVNKQFKDGSLAGRMDIIIRCTGFANFIAANVVFAPAASNFAAPFVTRCTTKADGVMELLTTPGEFEQSQK